MGDESNTDHNKGTRFITAAAAEPLRKLQGMLKQPWKGVKQQFALDVTIMERRQQGKKQKGCNVLVLLPADVKPRGL